MSELQYDSKNDLHVIAGMEYETEAITAVKDFVCDEIIQQTEFIPMDGVVGDGISAGEGSVSNGIELADRIVTALLRAGMLIPSDLTRKSIAQAGRNRQ